MSNCDSCVGVEAEHHLCDECVQNDIESWRALRAEVERLRAEIAALIGPRLQVTDIAREAYRAEVRAALAGSPVETRRPSASLALHDRALAERVREACVKAISVPRRSIAWSPHIEGLINDLRALDLDALLEEP